MQALFPHAVCKHCHWVQIHYKGSHRAITMFANAHSDETGHTTRIKYHHEFSDLLFTEEFIKSAYGEPAMLAWREHGISPDAFALLTAYHTGASTLEECEERYACSCEHCVPAEPLTA